MFEYNLFTVATGSNWDLSEQNRGYITLNNGGFGGITMTDNLNDFTFEVNFTGAKAEGQTNEVRNEIRLAFSNGKYLALDLLYSNGAGIIQTPTWGDGYLYASWDAKYTMTAEESETYSAIFDGVEKESCSKPSAGAIPYWFISTENLLWISTFPNARARRPR